MGKKVEREHAPTVRKLRKNPNMSDQAIYTSIAKDHLNEFPDYYTGLAKMENELEKKKQKRNFEKTVEAFMQHLDDEILTEATLTEENIERMIIDYQNDLKARGKQLLLNAKRLKMNPREINQIRDWMNPPQPVARRHESSSNAQKVLSIYNTAIETKKEIQRYFDALLDSFKQGLKGNLLEKQIKDSATGVAIALNRYNPERAYADLMGNITLPAKMVLIDLLKEQGISIPVRYSAVFSDPVATKAVIGAKMNPSYPLGKLFTFVALSALSNVLMKIPDGNPMKAILSHHFLNSIVNKDKQARNIIEFITKNNSGYELPAFESSRDGTKMSLRRSEGSLAQPSRPSITSRLEDQEAQKEEEDEELDRLATEPLEN